MEPDSQFPVEEVDYEAQVPVEGSKRKVVAQKAVPKSQLQVADSCDERVY